MIIIVSYAIVLTKQVVEYKSKPIMCISSVFELQLLMKEAKGLNGEASPAGEMETPCLSQTDLNH